MRFIFGIGFLYVNSNKAIVKFKSNLPEWLEEIFGCILLIDFQSLGQPRFKFNNGTGTFHI